MALSLTVRTISGEVLASFEAEPSWTAERTAAILAEAAVKAGRKFRQYQLVYKEETLAEESVLGDVVGKLSGDVELTAIAKRVTILKMDTVTGAALLPTSGDLVVASQGPLAHSKSQVPKGKDDGDWALMWLWRLSLSSGYAAESAILLARISNINHAEMEKGFAEAWNQWTSMKSGGQADPNERLDYGYTGGELEALGEKSTPQFSAAVWKSTLAFLHGHDDVAVLLAWNRPDWFGSIGIIERLNADTGEVVQLARISDLWSVTTDPRDGTVFCSICYSSAVIMMLEGVKVWEVPPSDAEAGIPKSTWRLLAEPPGFNFGLTFDPALGCLVANIRNDPDSFYLVCPAGESFEYIRSLPGVQVADVEFTGADEYMAKVYDRMCSTWRDQWLGFKVSAPWKDAGSSAPPEEDSDSLSKDFGGLLMQASSGYLTQVKNSTLNSLRGVQLVTAPGRDVLEEEVVNIPGVVRTTAGTLQGEHPLVVIV